MRCPFPGMDPWLEHPALWPDVHNRTIAAIGDELTPKVAPRYYVALERRTYHLTPDDLVFVGRPDLAVIRRGEGLPASPAAAAASRPRAAGAAVLDVVIPTAEDVSDAWLEVRDVATGVAVTVLELLSPANKSPGKGREDYLAKREEIFATRTNLVEIDLHRGGEPMPVAGRSAAADYRVLVRRGREHPRARLFVFGVRDPLPCFGIPLAPGDAEPELDLGDVLHRLYQRARFDLRLDYRVPPVPPLAPDDQAWAEDLARSAAAGG